MGGWEGKQKLLQAKELAFVISTFFYRLSLPLLLGVAVHLQGWIHGSEDGFLREPWEMGIQGSRPRTCSEIVRETSVFGDDTKALCEHY